MPHTPDRPLRTLPARADRLILGAVVASALVALAVGVHMAQTTLALTVASALLALGTMATLVAPGTLASRLVLAACLMGMTALHIQLGRGALEYHFGVFVTLGMLLVYQDWRPIVAAAGLIAVHHVLFDRRR